MNFKYAQGLFMLLTVVLIWPGGVQKGYERLNVSNGSSTQPGNLSPMRSSLQSSESEVVVPSEEGSAGFSTEPAVTPANGEAAAPMVKMTNYETMQAALVICPVWFLANLCYNASLNYTSVTSNTILSVTSGLFTFMFGVLTKTEPFSMLKLLGVFSCIGGTVAVALDDKEVGGTDRLEGDLICLLGAFLYGAYVTLLNYKLPSDDVVRMPLFFGYLGLFNSTLLLPILLILYFTGVSRLDLLRWDIFGWICLKGLFDNVLSDYLWARSVLLTSPTVVTVGLSLTVPFSILFDLVFHGIVPSRLSAFGACLVCVGFLNVNISKESVDRWYTRLASCVAQLTGRGRGGSDRGNNLLSEEKMLPARDEEGLDESQTEDADADPAVGYNGRGALEDNRAEG
eukprot:g65303.t1